VGAADTSNINLAGTALGGRDRLGGIMLELFRSRRRAIVWFVEASLLALLVTAVAGTTVGWNHAIDREHVLRAAIIALVVQGSLYYHGLYGLTPIRGVGALFSTVARALVIAGAFLWLLFRFVPETSAGGFSAYAFALGGAAVVLPAWRTALVRVSESKRFRCAALVLGSGPLSRACAEAMRSYDAGMLYAGRLVPDGDDSRAEPDVLGIFGDLERIVREKDIRQIIVAYPDRRAQFPVEQLLSLKFQGIEIEEGIEFYERVTGKLFVPELRASHIIFAHGFHVTPRTLVLKRVLDIFCATVGLILAAPLMALAAIAIKLESRGPVFYSQERSGEHGRPFMIHKFRSMRVDAEADGRARWASLNDPRVTRVGQFIRKTRIDELPQLWNVLVGEMSLVGPRPERPVFNQQLEKEIPFFKQRLQVKPGITGYAQVRCQYGATIEDQLEKLQYDLFYIKTFSLWFDISIMLDTVKVVLCRIGAR
jgi:sugar transferase (PEP-CTERM system associated)